MHNTEQTLDAAISELRSLNPDRPADLSELYALRAAMSCIEELVRSCVDELRSAPERPTSWADIAYALGEDSADRTRMRFTRTTSTASDQVVAFWDEFEARFVWDFLPAGFLFALYAAWLPTHAETIAPLSPERFSRRLKAVATSTGSWEHKRVRVAPLLHADEPLVAQAAGWTRPEGNAAFYGLRRAAEG